MQSALWISIGFYCPGDDAAYECQKGTVAPDQQMSICTDCFEGTVAPIKGMKSCVPCLSGTIAPYAGMILCDV